MHADAPSARSWPAAWENVGSRPVSRSCSGWLLEQAASGVDVSTSASRARRGRDHAVQLPLAMPLCGIRTCLTVTPSSLQAEGPPRRSSRPPVAGRACLTASSPSSTATSEAVDTLLMHPDVAAVSFVGSTLIAKYILRRDRGPPTASGSRPSAAPEPRASVLPDADLDVAADAIVSAAYGAAGERCMAPSVAVAVGDIADPRRRDRAGTCLNWSSATVPRERTRQQTPILTRHR